MAPSGEQCDAGLAAAVDDADGQVEEQIDDARRLAHLAARQQPAEGQAKLGPDAGKAGHRAEKGVENVRPHRPVAPVSAIADRRGGVEWMQHLSADEALAVPVADRTGAGVYISAREATGRNGPAPIVDSGGQDHG